MLRRLCFQHTTKVPASGDVAVNSFRDSLVQMMNAAPTDFIGHLETDVPDYV